MLLNANEISERLRALAELEKRLSFRLTRLSKLLDGHAARQLARVNLNLTWYRILMVVDLFREITAADVSKLTVIDRAQISRAAADLIRKGYLETKPAPDSKRKKLLKLTKKGVAVLEATRPLFMERQNTFTTLLSEEELRCLNSAIDKLSAYFARELDQPEAAPSGLRR